MMSLEGKYEYYRCMQHDFNEAYKLISKYVQDLYILPKNFVDTTGPVLDRYIKEYNFNVAGPQTTSLDTVVEFIDQLDEFTEKTLTLFKQHKVHADKSKAYLTKVAQLNDKCMGKIVSEYAVEYVELTPELMKLNDELRTIKARADEMVERLEKLELRWESLRAKVHAA
jgi:hypothetical protein